MKNFYIFLLFICTSTFGQAQMTATFDKTINNFCDGVDCFYSGPSIMINEIMIAPLANNGSISGPGNDLGRAEWIELYNPNLCEPVDISCYYLGSSSPQTGGSIEGQAFQLPADLIVPPGGFCIVRGINAAAVPSELLVENGGRTVEVIVPAEINEDGICVGGASPSKLWFPDSGGWFAFYDADGEVQDAISWGTPPGPGIEPCVAKRSSCNNNSVTSLASLNDIPADRKERVYNTGVMPTGYTIQREVDGGTWTTNKYISPSYGDCNDECAEPYIATCDGEATINVSGGSGNYSYVWDDSQRQLTQTATELCAGIYTVTVTDKDTGKKQNFTVEVFDFSPDVKLAFKEKLQNDGQTVSLDDIATYSPKPISDQTGVFSGTGIIGSDFDVSVSGEGAFPIIYTFTDENECTNSAIDTLIVFNVPKYEFPNVFTPNGDNNNDTWSFVYHKHIENIELVVLNRWGNQVFESNDPNFQWNGKINNSGAECVDGTYFYKAIIENTKGKRDIEEHGFIQLVRD